MQTANPLRRPKGKGTWLHTGCGLPADFKTPFLFKGWREIRLDADERVEPDVVASITDMRAVKGRSVDATWCCHCLEHIYTHEVPQALLEFRRVIKPDGFSIFQVPDLQSVGQMIAEGRLYDTAYEVKGIDPVAPIDMLYGYRKSVASGNHYMAHKTGFTTDVLRTALLMCGYRTVFTQSHLSNLHALAFARRLTRSEVEAVKREVAVFSTPHPAFEKERK